MEGGEVMKVKSIKKRVEAKVAKAKSKIARKCGKAAKAVLAIACLSVLLTGCMGTTTPSRSQTLTLTECTINIYGSGDGTTNDVARVDIANKNCFGGSNNDYDWLLNNYNNGSAVNNMGFEVYSGGRRVFYSPVWATLINGTFHEIIIDKVGGSVKMLLDGTQVASGTATGTPTKGRVCVFSQNNTSGSTVSPIANRVPRKVSIAAFQLWEGQTLVSDLVPAFANDGELCFFDRVTKDYARNLANAGSFLVGEPLTGMKS